MTLHSFKCAKCGNETEEFIKNDSDVPVCPVCGEKMKRKYSGRCYGAKKDCAGTTGCTHNCATCGGCGK